MSSTSSHAVSSSSSSTTSTTTLAAASPFGSAAKDDDDDCGASCSWSSDTTCRYNGQSLSFTGSLSYDAPLIENCHVALERGRVYGLVGPNGSGKTSLVRALPHLPKFPASLTWEYLSPDVSQSPVVHHQNDNNNNSNAKMLVSITAREYCLARIATRVANVAAHVADLERRLEEITSSNDDIDDNLLERLSDDLAEWYDVHDELVASGQARVDRMLEDLRFGFYRDQPWHALSSGWRYKCELVSALVTQPDCLVLDEPSFLDRPSTAWLVQQLDELRQNRNHHHKNQKSAMMVLLISHKEALLEQVCDGILCLNPASRALLVYHCSYREFQRAHQDRVHAARRNHDKVVAHHHQAQTSLTNLKQQLHKREQNLRATTRQHADQRFIKGKNKEAKQKADHAAAAKAKRLAHQLASVTAEQHAVTAANHVAPLVLEGPPSVATGHAGVERPLIELQDVAFSYDASVVRDETEHLLHSVCAQVAAHDKILVGGANGEGKSTLIQLLLGHLTPTRGTLRYNHVGRIAYFPQEALPELVQRYGSWTPVDFLQRGGRAATAESRRDEQNVQDDSLRVTTTTTSTTPVVMSTLDARQQLGKFGLKGNLATRPIQLLSAGQRVRLWLAREFSAHHSSNNNSDEASAAANRPALLVVDEISENLDKDTTESLLQSLQDYSGAVVAISHDDYFCEQFVSTQIWTVGMGGVRTEYQ